MLKVKIYNQNGEEVGELELLDKIFGVKVSEALVHQVAVAQMGNERQVFAHTKDRSEVRGGGKKPWKQKGTGRARHGSSRSPIWIGGGVTFGPRKEENYKKKINKKMKQKAIQMVLSDRVESGNFSVLDKIEAGEYKTKNFEKIVKNLEKLLIKNKEKKKENRSFLIVNDKKDEKAIYSAKNLAGVNFINIDNINILDLLKYKYLVITAESLKKLEARYK